MNIQDEIRENQAARIRWLLERVGPDVYWEFTLNYCREHPFPVENPQEEASSADDV